MPPKSPPQGKLEMIPTARCRALRRNPQFLTPHQMEALKASIRRDGFLAPILVRPIDGEFFEVLSGNHRLLAAMEEGMDSVPALVVHLTDKQAKRVALNLNTVHGDPSAELVAPFLAELDDDLLKSVHLPNELLAEIKALDKHLDERFSQLNPADFTNTPSTTNPVPTCLCPTCGKKHAPPTNTEG